MCGLEVLAFAWGKIDKDTLVLHCGGIHIEGIVKIFWRL
jgi:hypothetical protein